MVAIALQESGLKHRWQVVDANKPDQKGPARGLLQFERGSKENGGGVWGVYKHFLSHEELRQLCHKLDVSFDPFSIWSELDGNDILALGVARLYLWVDRKPLPAINDADGAWNCYLRNWRPGKPHPLAWPINHATAVKALEELNAGATV